MTDDTNSPFGTFTPQPVPMFEDAQKNNETQAAIPPASPKRKSRRSKSEVATTSKPSSTKATAPVRRKYTRKKVGAEVMGVEFGPDGKPRKIGQPVEPSVSLEALVLFRNLSEPEYNAVRALMKLGPDSTARIFAALQAVLPK